MALDRLLSVLVAEADSEVAAVLAEARTEAATLRARAEAEVAARRASETRRWEEERAQALSHTQVEARRRARDVELAARDRLLTQVLERARPLLPAALHRSEFETDLPRLVEEALGCLGERAATLRAPPALAARLGPLVRGRASLELTSDPAITSGFVVESRDGSLFIDATLEHRLEQLGPRLRQEILARLEERP